MVPCVYGLIGVQFNPICIQFIESLYSIRFVLLDSLYVSPRGDEALGISSRLRNGAED